MITRHYVLVTLSIWLSLTTRLDFVAGDRWSRQVSNSEWIPLAQPRSQFSQTSTNQLPLIPSSQSLNLSPESKQEYQQQLAQLHRNQDSIQKLLVLQQQLRGQQQHYQNQAYIPNAASSGTEKKAFHLNTINNIRGLPESASEILTPPRLTSDALPPVYLPHEFGKTNFPFKQGQYEIVRAKSPSINANNQDATYSSDSLVSPLHGAEKSKDNNDEIQVVYVPAETLAQRGQPKEERNHDYKLYNFPQSQQFEHHSRFPERHPQESSMKNPAEQYTSFNSKLTQFPRYHDERDEFLKVARHKELDRYNEIRLEMQKQAKLQMAKTQREQEKLGQIEDEQNQKAQVEKALKQREYEKLQQPTEENYKLKKNEQFMELKNQERNIPVISTAGQLFNHQRQHHIETTNQSKLPRFRNKSQTRLHNNNYNQHHVMTNEDFHQNQDLQTTPPTPNQPPLAVFMGHNDQTNNIKDLKIEDVLRVLRYAKTIAVLDQVSTDAPKVFVGPLNLELPQRYAKFELPYLSSLETNRIESRVNKLPFFVAPQSFIPPQGYSKIPFPAPHIGSVIINNIDSISPFVKPLANLPKFNLKPVIESDSFISNSGAGSSFEVNHQSPTTPIYTEFIYDHITPQYHQSYSSTPNVFRQQQYEQPAMHAFSNQETIPMSAYQNDVTSPTQSPNQYSESSEPGSLTPGLHRRPTGVSSYNHKQEPVTTTSSYHDQYSYAQNKNNNQHQLGSQFEQMNHNYPQHHLYQQQHDLSFASNKSLQNIPRNQYQGLNAHTQDNLPGEHLPIHNQLHDHINSPSKNEKEIENREPIELQQQITTTLPVSALTTTTEFSTTTHRIHTRQRHRTARPTITPITTTPTYASKVSGGQVDPTRRPFNRSRSRFTSTTEEYMNSSSESTQDKELETPESLTNANQHRYPTANKKLRLRDRGTYETSTLNQIQSERSYEPSADEKNTEIDYSVTPNYPKPPKPSHDRRTQINAESQFKEGLTRPIPDGIVDQVPSTLVVERNHFSENNKSYDEPVSTDFSVSLQPLKYRPNLQSEEYLNPSFDSAKVKGSNEQSNRHFFAEPTETTTEEFESTTKILTTTQPQQPSSPPPPPPPPPPPTTTTTTITTTTTTTPASLVIRQRVRARLNGSTHQESPIQTQSNGSQNEYVRFSAIDLGPSDTLTSTNNRQQNSTRPRIRTRPHHQKEIQSEGNDYVRIQSSSRSKYPKTILQTVRQRTKSTTTTTTTTLAPLTTSQNADVEYGFIGRPISNQSHNQLSSKYRAPASQIQLQNITTDETTEDSSPTHLTHVNMRKHRQKYQSPNRSRPSIKSNAITTTPLSIDIPTNKSRVRLNEPKNRVRIKSRLSSVRKRLPSTSTTTEYVLEGKNDLPEDENYPKLPFIHTERSIERHSIYDNSNEMNHEKAQESGNSRADYFTENYPKQVYEIDSEIKEQRDQSHLGQKNYGLSRSRSKSYLNQPVEQEGDIYGAESQWSTKLTQSSFQPSNLNQLSRNSEKSLSLEQNTSEANDNGPEIITAQPKLSFVTVLVDSDHSYNETKEDNTPTFMQSTDFQQKISSDDTIVTTQDIESNTDVPVRKSEVVRKRRVRIRVRPISNTFETTESPHTNPTFDSHELSDATEPDHIQNSVEATTQSLKSIVAERTEDSINSLGETRPMDFNNEPTMGYTEIPENSTMDELSTDLSTNSEESMENKDDNEKVLMTTESLPVEINTTLRDITTITPAMSTETITEKSKITAKNYADWFVEKPQKYFQTDIKVTDNNNDAIDRKKTKDDTVHSEESTKNYPKNHRSEWSEVRYPNNRGTYGYARSEKLPPTTGTVDKSVSDTGVKTLSDYVQAIFDTMKNADERRELIDNLPYSSQNEKEKNSISNQVSRERQNEESIDTNKDTASNTQALSSVNKDSAIFQFQTDIKSSTIFPSIPTMPNILLINQSPSDFAKDITQTKSDEISGTSTSTRVSQMTEICYRGRCVMTKPRKDSQAR